VSGRDAATGPVRLRAPRYDLDLRIDLLPDLAADGRGALPTGPVLGVEINQDFLSKNRSDGWRRRVPVRPDGSIAYN
jgi:hypothetical protein